MTKKLFAILYLSIVLVVGWMGIGFVAGALVGSFEQGYKFATSLLGSQPQEIKQ